MSFSIQLRALFSPSAQPQRPFLAARHILPTHLDSLEDSEPSEPLISSESEESSLASLQISLTSESISIPQNIKISRNSATSFDQPSESEFVTIHGVPMFHQERADDSVLSRTDMRRHS